MRTFLLSSFVLFIVFLSVGNTSVIKGRSNMHGARYGEIVLITGGPFNFTGQVYNTIGMNNCPESQWKALNSKKLAKEFKAFSVLLNGPRYFLMDEASLANPGKIVSFDGLQARLLAQVTIPLFSLLRGSNPYVENKVARTTVYVFKKGRTVYELISPKGATYVMQSYAQIVDPKLTEADLTSLGSRLTLPPGWKYQSRVLTQDLILKIKGMAYVIQDNFKNTYQKE